MEDIVRLTPLIHRRKLLKKKRPRVEYPIMNGIEKNSVLWNLWHGCHKLSPGCANCYVYRADAGRDVDTTVVTRTGSFDLPVRRRRDGSWKIAPGTMVYTCFTSDFFVEDADIWRQEAWAMIRERQDLRFLMITKRIDRFAACLPDDWADGYENVTVCCTVENQAMADLRLPIYLSAPIKHKTIICEPLLGHVNLRQYITAGCIEQVVAGGESGRYARPCHFDWILDIREVCAENGIGFWFKQTGAIFIKDGRAYRVPRSMQHSQARRAGINLEKPHLK